MADEITYSTSIKIEKGNISLERKPEVILIDWVDGEYFQATQNVEQYAETLNYAAINSLPSLGLLWIRNTGSENLWISFDAGITNPLTVKAGEYFTMRLTQDFTISNLTVQAFTTSTTIEYILFSN